MAKENNMFEGIKGDVTLLAGESVAATSCFYGALDNIMNGNYLAALGQTVGGVAIGYAGWRQGKQMIKKYDRDHEAPE